MYILENNPIELLILLYVVIYGIALGVKNTVMRLVYAIQLRSVRQANYGKVLDAAFIVGIVYLWLWQPMFIDEVLAGITW